MGILLGLQFREQLPPLVAEELDQLTAAIDRDFGLETVSGTVLLTASGSETRVLSKIENTRLSGVGVAQIQLGDGAAASNAWTLDALVIPITEQERR